jgi:high affinity Mn2+ porin
VTDASMSFDLELSAPVGENGALFALVEAGSGEGVDGELATIWGFNGDADDDANLRLTEAWYEHAFGDGELTVRIGKIDVGAGCGRNEAGFDANALANDECSQFLSPGFVNSIAIEAPDDNGFGVIAWWSPHEFVEVGLGLADADADWDNVGDNVFSIVQIDLKPVFGGRQGHYRFLGWANDKPHALIQDPGRDDRIGHGFGFSADQQLTDWLAVFGRYGWQRPDVYEVEHAWSAGLQLSGSLWGRENDSFGLAYGEALLGDEQEQVYRDAGVPPDDEHHFELYYNIAIREGIVITPDAQYAKNPECNGDNDEVWVLGVRAQLSF